MPTPRLRKNVSSLSAQERKAYVDALVVLKARGRYDKYVHWHHHVMNPSVLPYEPNDASYRNFAHRGPSFLPWHREFLMHVENDLRGIDESLTIPYWDWSQDAALDDPASAPVWAEDFMGGNGVSTDQWRVATGPFAHAKGKWKVPAYPDDELPEPGLKRAFGVVLPTLPTAGDVKLAMSERFYDTPSFNQSPFNVGFRNRLEGWITKRGDPRVTTEGSQLHNRVHLWVGGNMVPMTSPDDPVFFLHHCFVDKIWADWQAVQRETNPSAGPHYAPVTGGPPGHNLMDQLDPWGEHTVGEMLDIAALGYEYEQPPKERVLETKAIAAEPTLPFNAEDSPFWAD